MAQNFKCIFRQGNAADEGLSKKFQKMEIATPAISARPASPDSDSGASLDSEDTVLLDQEPFVRQHGELTRPNPANPDETLSHVLEPEDMYNRR